MEEKKDRAKIQARFIAFQSSVSLFCVALCLTSGLDIKYFQLHLSSHVKNPHISHFNESKLRNIWGDPTGLSSFCLRGEIQASVCEKEKEWIKNVVKAENWLCISVGLSGWYAYTPF